MQSTACSGIFGLNQHPRGLWLLVTTEFWERFSYYAMTGMLVLFLVTPVTSGGFGWSSGSALRLLGAYTGAIYLAPLIGGYLADRWLSPRRCLYMGVALQALGHLSMVGPAILPWAIAQATGIPVDQAMHTPGLVLGSLSPADQLPILQEAMARRGLNNQDSLAAASFAYSSVSWSFYFAIAVIVLGVGLAKSNALVIVGRLYGGRSSARDAGYTFFYAATNVGAMTSNLVAGTVGERFGWHVGFSVAGLGMLIGLVAYRLLERRLLGDAGASAAREHSEQKVPFSQVEKDGLKVVAMLSGFFFFYFIAYNQVLGLINLFVQNQVDRRIGDSTIPVTWFQSLNPLLIIVLVPLTAPLLERQARRSGHVDQAGRFSFGFAMLAIGFGLMCGAALDVASTGERTGMLWVAGAIACISVGEVVMAPSALAAVNRYAPRRIASITVAAFLSMVAAGAWSSGQVGALVETVSPVAIFLSIGLMCAVCAAAALLVRPRLMRWTRGADAEEVTP